MRLRGLVMLALAGCAPQPETAEADRSGLVSACAAAVAAHVGKGTDAVTAEWTGTTPEGMGLVTVTDAQGAGGERVHTCQVDGTGRVLRIDHPGA
jgi:hypothetical protein